MTIARVSSDDLMSLATDRGRAPMQVGAVLTLETMGNFDPQKLIEEIDARLSGIPRLRQRLVHVRTGLGRPVWLDDAGFSIGDHVTVSACPEPGGRSGVLVAAADLVTARLPRSRPLWAASIVTGTGDGRSALIFVFHHVLADGIGGLAVLAQLATAKLPPDDPEFPRPAPTNTQLLIDAFRSRSAIVLSLPSHFRRGVEALKQLSPSLHDAAERTSLNEPIGVRRRFEWVSLPLTDVRNAAHAAGGTVNDFALAAITGALHSLLGARGEQLDVVVVSVPFSSRVHTDGGTLGNKSGAVPLRLPATGEPQDRLRDIASITRAAKASPPGSSSTVLGPLFRALARLGLFQRFVDHQRTIHTIVTDIKGPQLSLTLGETTITDLVPLVAIVGNVTVAFAVSSYVDRVTITLVADPDSCPDFDDLCGFLDAQCAVLAGPLKVGS